MEPRYITIMDYSDSSLIRIRLTDREIEESEKYEDFDDFLTTLEEKYGFRMKDCLFMVSQNINEYCYNLY